MVTTGRHCQDELVPNAPHPFVTLLKIQIPGKKILHSLTCPSFDQDNTDTSSNRFFLPLLYRIRRDGRDWHLWDAINYIHDFPAAEWGLNSQQWNGAKGMYAISSSGPLKLLQDWCSRCLLTSMQVVEGPVQDSEALGDVRPITWKLLGSYIIP